MSTQSQKRNRRAEPEKVEKRTRPLSLNEALAIIKRCDRLFGSAARAWERTSGSEEGRNKMERLRCKAEVILAPLGVSCDYPGLYPAFKVTLTESGSPREIGFYNTQSAVGAAMEEIERQRRNRAVDALDKLVFMVEGLAGLDDAQHEAVSNAKAILRAEGREDL